MPFTPFHLGPGVLIGLLFYPFLDIPCILLASIIVDLEPLALWLQNAPILHAFFHTHFGASIAALAIIPCLWLLRRPLQYLMRMLGLPQISSIPRLVFTSLIGVNLHIFLDALLYPEMHPFWPLLGNPFFGLVSSQIVYFFCILSFLFAIPLYGFQVIRHKKTLKK